MSRENKPAIGLNPVLASSNDEALAVSLKAVLERGHHAESHPPGEIHGSSGFKEIIDFQVQVADPRNRVLTNPVRQLRIIGAIARFVWMVSASDRLADIEFYEPKVKTFSDNALSVPGSNYGMRLFQPVPGTSQVVGVIKRLEAEKGSRQGAAVIWRPEDAVRFSKDIPCAFGTFYHVRDAQLVATTIMRSNNAFVLLPYNIFEFTLLGEIIAVSLGVQPGPYVHFSASMHVFDKDVLKARDAIRAYQSEVAGRKREPMPPMPAHPKPLGQALQLAKLDAKLRHDHGKATLKDLILPATDTLHPYWCAYYRVLLVHALLRVGRLEEAREVLKEIPGYFSESVARSITDAESSRDKPQESAFAEGTEELTTGLPELLSALSPTEEEIREGLDQVEEHCFEIERRTGQRVSMAELKSLKKKLVTDRPHKLAARSEGPDKGPQDRGRISLEEVQEALGILRGQR